MDSFADPITDHHFPNRILFLIDLTPLALLRLCGRDSQSYLNCVLSAANPFLSNPQFSSALFAFKPFFSALSPLLSSSKLPPPYSSLHLSFLDQPQTLTSLTRLLVDLQGRDFASVSGFPRASHIAAGLRQVLHEYDWGTVLEDDAEGDSLVVLVAPVSRNREQLCMLLESNGDDDDVGVLGLGKEDFGSRACEVFKSVRDVFVSKRIRLCWIDAEYEAEERTVEGAEGTIEFAGFKEGIKRLGWGFCSSESIVLGSAFLPFGLIYPYLGLSSCRFRINDCVKRVRGSLNLEIMDVSAKPLECKCCEIELTDYNIRDRNQTQLSLSREFVYWPDTDMEREDNTYLDKLANREVRICFLNVQRRERFAKLKEQFIEPILVTEYLGEHGSDNNGKRPEFFADKVLNLLMKDMGEFGRKSPPLWQIILSFMYREGYWALVSLQDEDGKSKHGILKPFTFSSALIFLNDDNIADLDINKAFDTFQSGNVDSCPSSSRKNCKQGETERRSKLHLLQNISWDDFRREALEGFEIKMEDEFFASKQNQSKKLKFLKCWMKQVSKSANMPLAIIKHSHLESGDDKVNDPGELPLESEHLGSVSTSAAEDSMTAASKVQDEVAVENGVKSCDDFLGSIPGKIRQGIELEGADLGALAERLVHSTIYWISQKYDSEFASESPSLQVATELMDLLLCEPKELSEKCKKDTAYSEQDGSSSAVREFELQILFRMEILRSQVDGVAKDSQQRFVKQICMLLECIQCQLEGGFFGDWSLDNYVEKIIKRRYFEVLEDVVNQIYSRMDLLLFNDEDEAPLNSEDSSYKSHRDDVGEEDVQRYSGDGGSNSAEGRFHQQEDHLRRLSDARERRERARRFKSFTSSMPDLLRVWAPRVLTSGKNKTDFSRKKGRRRETRDMVLETPFTENKRSCNRMRSPSSAVSKALFPEDP